VLLTWMLFNLHKNMINLLFSYSLYAWLHEFGRHNTMARQYYIASGYQTVKWHSCSYNVHTKFKIVCINSVHYTETFFKQTELMVNHLYISLWLLSLHNILPITSMQWQDTKSKLAIYMAHQALLFLYINNIYKQFRRSLATM